MIKEFSVDNYRFFDISRGSLRVCLANLGAAICEFDYIRKDGRRIEVLKKSHSPQDFINAKSYNGRIIGRVANRIEDAKFMFDGEIFDNLHIKEGYNEFLHGGEYGLSFRKFDYKKNEKEEYDEVLFSTVIREFEDNFPGDFKITMVYRVSEKELQVGMIAKHLEESSRRRAFLNLSHHPYFSLRPADQKDSNIDTLTLQLPATSYLPVKNNLCVYSPEKAAPCTLAFDFIRPQQLGAALFPPSQADEEVKRIISNRMKDLDSFAELSAKEMKVVNGEQRLLAGGGIDHCFIMDHDLFKKWGYKALLISPESSMGLRIVSNFPAMHVYTTNYAEEGIGRHEAVSLEPEFRTGSVSMQGVRPELIIPRGDTHKKFIRYIAEEL